MSKGDRPNCLSCGLPLRRADKSWLKFFNSSGEETKNNYTIERSSEDPIGWVNGNKQPIEARTELGMTGDGERAAYGLRGDNIVCNPECGYKLAVKFCASIGSRDELIQLMSKAFQDEAAPKERSYQGKARPTHHDVALRMFNFAQQFEWVREGYTSRQVAKVAVSETPEKVPLPRENKATCVCCGKVRTLQGREQNYGSYGVCVKDCLPKVQTAYTRIRNKAMKAPSDPDDDD